VPVPAAPDYPPAQLTTGELLRVRADLEHKLTGQISDARRRLLRGELDAVMAEQAERAASRAVPGSWPPI
jgi:hypothetical protein